MIACDDGLTVWDLDSARSGNATDPVMVQQLNLLGAEPVAVAKAVFWGPLLLAANNPGRYTNINPDGWNYSQGTALITAENVVLPSLEGQIRDLHSVGEQLFVLTDAGSAGRLYKYAIADPAAPVLVGQLDFAPGPLAVAITFRSDDDCSTAAESLVVVRRGWGIELVSLDLVPLSSRRLPGDAQAAYWDWGAYVLLGNFGVARVLGPAAEPTIDYLRSNQLPPGKALHRSSGIIATPEGPTW